MYVCCLRREVGVRRRVTVATDVVCAGCTVIRWVASGLCTGLARAMCVKMKSLKKRVKCLSKFVAGDGEKRRDVR